MKSQSLVELAQTLPGWTPRVVHDCGAQELKLINATSKPFEFDVHDHAETLICLQGAYVIETPHGEISIPEGASFTVPVGLRHRPANREDCVILVLS
ncbi:MAG TPA: hypothetical protein VG843_07555 [Rhizomicrobium sp.]|jgi:mannose-6-phosphate isomerase-like protein (cupin superfamily)|nr:hypothetical protein [Rhizomicrobium sp.]